MASTLINRMLLHVHENINNADKLRITYLAGHFNLSANYVGEYFRKLTNIARLQGGHEFIMLSNCLF